MSETHSPKAYLAHMAAEREEAAQRPCYHCDKPTTNELVCDACRPKEEAPGQRVYTVSYRDATPSGVVAARDRALAASAVLAKHIRELAVDDVLAAWNKGPWSVEPQREEEVATPFSCPECSACSADIPSRICRGK